MDYKVTFHFDTNQTFSTKITLSSFKKLEEAVRNNLSLFEVSEPNKIFIISLKNCNIIEAQKLN